jgi:hypothetical protein
MNMTIPDELDRPIRSLEGLECWAVHCGGAAGSTFQLALGERRPLPAPFKKTKHAESLPQFEAEASILIWCAWRLDASAGPVTSWDDTNESVEAALTKLIGSRIDSVELIPPAWDMNIKFSNSLCLRVFCDHVPGDPSFEGNWDVRTQDVSITVGPGSAYRTEPRSCAKNA